RSEREIVHGLHHRNRGSAAHAFGKLLADRHGRKRTLAGPLAETQEAAQPSAGGDASMFHQVLRVEVRAGIVFGTGSMHNRKVAVVVGALQRLKQRVTAQETW